jgi:hypothetical protein
MCGKHLSLRERALKVCSSATCRIEYLHEEGRRLRLRLRAQAEALRAQGGAALGVERPASYPLAVIPSLTAPLVNLAERRRRAFRDRLMELIAEASKHRNTPTQPTPLSQAICKTDAPPPAEVHALLGAACATCRGHCCATGGVHAYLSVDTIRRFMDANPHLRPRDVLEAYLSRLPNKSLEGSCVYHTNEGCALPREMRSDISLHYFCEPLWELQRTLAEAEERKSFVAAADDHDVVRAAFVGVNEYRPVAPRTA